MKKERIELFNELIKKVGDGSVESLNLLYELMSPTIWHIALKYLNNFSDAQDAVQQFWSDIYKTSASFIFMQNGFSFLCRVMTRKTINIYRKRNKERKATVNYVDYSELEIYTIDENLENTPLKLMVSDALKTLPEIQRIILQEIYFEQKTLKDISKELNIPITTVFDEKNRAMKTLKKIFEESE